MKRGIHLIAGIAIGALMATVAFAISSREQRRTRPRKAIASVLQSLA